MNEIVLGYFDYYEIERVGGMCRVELYDLQGPGEDANYKVSIVNGTLFIYQNDSVEELFPERVISNFDVEFMGEWAARD